VKLLGVSSAHVILDVEEERFFKKKLATWEREATPPLFGWAILVRNCS
jgi:hypothetical protein